jgi:pimeloyl-ACP methyl ester carboxylesterase
MVPPVMRECYACSSPSCSVPRIGRDVDFIFLEGEEVIEPGHPNYEEAEGVRRFFKGEVLRTYTVSRLGKKHESFYDRLPETVAMLDERIALLGSPPPLLLGFSQGANLALCCAGRRERRRVMDTATESYPGLILLEPNVPGFTSQYPEAFEQPLCTPALLVSADRGCGAIGAPEAVKALFRDNADVEHLRHAEGHKPLPSEPGACERVVNRVLARVRR